MVLHPPVELAGFSVQPALVDQMSQKNGAKTIFGVLPIFLTLGILIGTLWPFNPFPTNNVIRLT